MQISFKLNNIQFGEVKVGNMEVSASYTIEEATKMYGLFRRVLKDTPDMMKDLSKAYETFNSIEQEQAQPVEEKASINGTVGVEHSACTRFC